MLHDGTEVKLARTIMRMPGAEKWNRDALVKVGCTLYDLHQPREPEVVFREKIDEKAENPKELISMARQVFIKPKNLERYGLTRGCRTTLWSWKDVSRTLQDLQRQDHEGVGQNW